MSNVHSRNNDWLLWLCNLIWCGGIKNNKGLIIENLYNTRALRLAALHSDVCRLNNLIKDTITLALHIDVTIFEEYATFHEI